MNSLTTPKLAPVPCDWGEWGTRMALRVGSALEIPRDKVQLSTKPVWDGYHGFGHHGTDISV